MKNLGNAIRKGANWIFVGQLVTTGANFVAGVILARLLVPEDFGAVTTVGVVTGIAGYFSGGGTAQALIRAPTISAKHFDVIFTFQILMGALIYGMIALAAGPFANFFNNPLYQSLLLVSGASLLVRPFGNVPAAKLSRDMNFKPVIVVRAGALLLGSGVSVVLALMGYGPWALVIGGMSGAVANALALRLVTRMQVRIAFDKAIIQSLGSYGFKVTLNWMISHFREQVLLLSISKALGPGDLGILNRAKGLSDMPMSIIGSSPYQAVLRALSSIHDNLDQSKYVYLRSIALVAVYTLPFCIGIWWLADGLVILVYGEKWSAAAAIVKILPMMSLVALVSNPSGAVLEARNRVGLEIIIDAAALVAVCILCAVAVYNRAPVMTYAAILLLTTVGYGMAATLVACRELRVKALELVGALVPSIVLGGFLILILIVVEYALFGGQQLTWVYLLTMSAAGGIVYGGMFLFFPLQGISTESAKWRSKLRETAGKAVDAVRR